jgi:hypothetical protein
MQTRPLDIEGLSGPLVITSNAFTGRSTVTVGGQPVKGSRRGEYALPTTDGRTVDARVRAGLFDPYPSLNIAGVSHRTGPPLPAALKVLIVLPLALILGGLIGGAAGAAGVLVNMAVGRSSQSTAVKAVLMVVVLAAAALVWLLLSAAFQTAVTGT